MRRLAARGAAVVVNDLGGDLKGQGSSASAAEQVVAEIVAAGGQALANHDNIATQAGASSLVGAAMQQFGRVDALINNAGIVRDKSLVKMDMADFEAVVRVHLMGSALCTRAVWPVFQARGYGRVVFTTSAAGLYGNFGQANYAAAKAGLEAMIACYGDEMANTPVRACLVNPGPMRTQMRKVAFPGEDPMTLPAPEEIVPLMLDLARTDQDPPVGVVSFKDWKARA
jgi:NAD(P)-dependent dehydrogenase (short-subunit alcohol dehydrogenase family)